MTDETKRKSADLETVRFANRLAASENFQGLFQEGMSLVEETAMYLDGEGRTESKQLSRPASLAYATESMRLTTRLMQLASWLLLQRAVNEGEMSQEQASNEKNRVRLEKLSTAKDNAVWDELPEALRDLIDRSIRLQKRVVHLDKMLYAEEQENLDANGNPVVAQLHQLRAAFGHTG